MEKIKLEEFNPWWISGEADPDLALPYKRKIYPELVKSLGKRFILALVGLRGVGKTTLLYQLIQHLLDSKIEKINIVFFSFDELSAKVEDVINTYNEIHLKDFRKERIYFFLDEIQKCSNWENELKKYYDLYPKIKFIVSGSESLFIRKKTKETLAGRIFEFILGPLDFTEYLDINKVKKEELKYETKIKPLFLRFVQFGGFPETIALSNKREFKEYVRSLVVDKIIYKDIPKIFRIEDPEFLVILLELISTNPGMYIDYQSLAKQFGKDRRVIKNYLLYLQESFLIRMLGNYRKGSTTLRKRKRAYPADNAFIQLYKPIIDETFFGRIVETSAINKLKAKSFWRNGSEVDVIHNGIPIEVKYREKIDYADFKGIIEFMKKFEKKESIVITKKDEKIIKIDEGKIKLIPAWKWLLS